MIIDICKPKDYNIMDSIWAHCKVFVKYMPSLIDMDLPDFYEQHKSEIEQLIVERELKHVKENQEIEI